MRTLTREEAAPLVQAVETWYRRTSSIVVAFLPVLRFFGRDLCPRCERLRSVEVKGIVDYAFDVHCRACGLVQSHAADGGVRFREPINKQKARL